MTSEEDFEKKIDSFWGAVVTRKELYMWFLILVIIWMVLK